MNRNPRQWSCLELAALVMTVAIWSAVCVVGAAIAAAYLNLEAEASLSVAETAPALESPVLPQAAAPTEGILSSSIAITPLPSTDTPQPPTEILLLPTDTPSSPAPDESSPPTDAPPSPTEPPPLPTDTPTSSPEALAYAPYMPSGERTIHVVQAGDSLWKIAKLYGVSLQTLREVNGLLEADLIKPGQELIIPAPGQAGPGGAPEPPSSGSGDSLPTPPLLPDNTAPTPAGEPISASGPPTRIVAPAIRLDAPVVPVGWQFVEEGGQMVSVWEVADFAAGWHKTSSYPGQPGNVVISGHHNIKGEVFRYLVDLKTGDEVDLYVGDKLYRYVVTEEHLLQEKGMPESTRRQNAQWIAPTADERLTLVTCWPYTNNTHRVIIIAKPIKE